MSEEQRHTEQDVPEQSTTDQPTVSLPREEAPAPPPDPGLPTSDPVFPTSSPQLRPPGDVSGYNSAQRVPPTPRPPRTAEQIRADIEAGRQELSQSVEVLRDKVNELTDWRGQIRKHRREITIAAAVVGFTIGARFMMRRRRR